MQIHTVLEYFNKVIELGEEIMSRNKNDKKIESLDNSVDNIFNKKNLIFKMLKNM